MHKAADATVPGSWRELWRVAWPLMVSSGSLSLMLVVDRAFLSWKSTEDLAASSTSGALFWSVISLGIGTAQYINTFVAQYEGAGRRDRVAASVWQGVYFSIVAGLLLLVPVPYSDQLFAWLGHETVIQHLEAEYFRALCLGGAPMIMTAALGSYYSGRGHTRIVMWVNLAAAAINGVLDPFFIFGIPRSGFDGWGIAGAAWATSLSNVFSAATFAFFIYTDKDAKTYQVASQWRLDGELFRRLLRFGVPQGVHMFFDVLSFTIFMQVVGTMGTIQLAATTLAFTLNIFSYVPLLGMGTAVMTLVGNRVGEGRPELAERTTWLAYAVCTAYILLFVVMYVGAPDLILLPFRWKMNPVQFAQLRAEVIVLLRFVAVYALFDGMAVVFGSAIRGAGDTRFAMLYSVLLGWTVMVMPTYFLTKYFSAGLIPAWWCVTVFIVVLGIGFFLRFKTGRWKSMQVIEKLESSTGNLAQAVKEN